MKIRVGNFDCTEVWDGIFYKKLSNYPQVTDWEIRTLIEFMDYENKYGRECTIECEDKELLSLIQDKIANRDKYLKAVRPKLLTECTACPYRKGCVTDYVCHTTSVENAIKIWESGKLSGGRPIGYGACIRAFSDRRRFKCTFSAVTGYIK